MQGHNQQGVLKSQAELFSDETQTSLADAIIEVKDIEEPGNEVLVNEVRRSEAAIDERALDSNHLFKGQGDKIDAELGVTRLPPIELHIGRPDAACVQDRHFAA